MSNTRKPSTRPMFDLAYDRVTDPGIRLKGPLTDYMEAEYRKVKKSSILRKLERYLWMSRRNKAKPEVGCFPVYVGPEKQRFVIKAEFANHPLFRTLLEDAESEYGFTSEGPLLLPCDVHYFCKVLAEMDSGDDEDDRPRGFGYGPCSPFRSGYGLLTPPRLLKINHF